jgi:hypothetical protein
MTGDRVNMGEHEIASVEGGDGTSFPAPRRYEPPRLTEKRALAEVTLFSNPTPCTPGVPGCQIGHP